MDVVGLLGKLDITAIVAAVVSFFVGLAVIRPKIAKAVAVIGDLADLLSALKSALEDGKLDKAEVALIIKEGEELIAEFKK